jgi:hypothetical protein
MSRWPWYGECGVCHQVRAIDAEGTMRRHGWPDVCEGTHCEPTEGTLGRTRAEAESLVATRNAEMTDE